jgi:hypothetical protein
MTKIISAPLIFPRLEPDSWDEWWSVWHENSIRINKVKQSHNLFLDSPWSGFDIYVKPGKEELAKNHYDFKNINRPDLFGNFFNNLDDFPLDIEIMRAASTFTAVHPHHDFTKPKFSIRALLYDTNPRQTWYYLFDDKKVYLKLPEETNFWIYSDHDAKHGTDFQFPYMKILLQFFGPLKPGYPEKSFDESMKKYKDFIIFKD